MSRHEEQENPNLATLRSWNTRDFQIAPSLFARIVYRAGCNYGDLECCWKYPFRVSEDKQPIYRFHFWLIGWLRLFDVGTFPEAAGISKIPRYIT
jgi:hypothetical protein